MKEMLASYGWLLSGNQLLNRNMRHVASISNKAGRIIFRDREGEMLMTSNRQEVAAVEEFITRYAYAKKL